MLRPVCLVFLLVLTPPARAADAWPVPRGPSREPAPYVYDPKTLATLPKEFLDDAAACVLYSGTTYLVEPDGTIENVTHEVSRLNGRKGIEKLGEHRSITYDPAYQKVTLHVALVHKPDGRKIELQPRHAQLRDVSTDYLVYDHEKQLVLSFPGLEVGDVLEVKWTVRGKNPEHAGHFFTRYSFGDPVYPVALDQLQVRLPKGKELKHAGRNRPPQAEVSDTAAGRLFRWRAVNCPRPSQDENLPSREELRADVVCSTFASWEEVGRFKHRLRADCWTCTPDVAQVVAEVTRGLNDPTAKARALAYWVRRNVRYVSVGEKHDYTPHKPDVVLANRYGDCKDTSQLLAVMLRHAGLKVELATLGARDDGQVLAEVPSPWGTHAILLVTIDGKEHWLDSTASLAAWDLLPRDDRDRVCYLIDDQGRLRMHRTPPATADDYRIDTVTLIRVGADGTSFCERTVTSSGNASIPQRDNFLEVPSGERRRQVTSELQDSHSSARLFDLGLDEKALRDFDRPVTVRMTYSVAGHFTGSPDKEGSVSDSKVWGRLLAYNIDFDRKTPFELSAPFESRHRYRISLPLALVFDGRPRPVSATSKWGRFSRTVKQIDERTLEIDIHTRIDKVRVEAGEIEEYRTFLDAVSKGYRAWLTLTPAGDLADAPALEALLMLAPGDSGSAAALARLYQKHGKHDEARRVLARARHYRPDNAELWELTVKSASDLVEEEAAQVELVKRWPEEAKYALALGALLVQRDRHDQARALLEPLTRKGSAANRAQAHYQLARSYYRKDELKEALAALDAAARADGETVNTVRAHTLRGQVLEELGRLKDAEQAFQRALEVDKEATFALDSLVRLKIAGGKTDEALLYLRRYALAVGDDVPGLLLAAEQFLRLDRPDEAFDLAQRAREQRFDAKAQRILGLVYLRRHDYANAVKHLDKADLSADVLEGLLNCHVALGDLRGAADRLRQVERVPKPTPELNASVALVRKLVGRRDELLRLAPPADGKADDWREAAERVACGEHFARSGSPGRAAALAALALEGAPEAAPALALRGRLALGRGKLRDALADAEKAIKAAPGLAGGYHVRGLVRLERDQPEALADLLKAAELSRREDADVLSGLASALRRAGRTAEALAVVRAALLLRPEDRALLEQLRELEKEEKEGRSDS
jgi:tetratricopeptide (TPR) repeat protein/transglutaminase-like putative cysteine protease